MKILMVCLGNICRSPLAEGILKTKIAAQGLDWEVASAGTGGYHVGELPDPRSIRTAQAHGIDITDQRSQKLQASDLATYDILYAMDATNYQNILKLAKTDEERAKVKMMMNEDKPGYNEQVPDPYWGDDGFELVYDMLDRACDGVIRNYGS